MCRQTRAAAAIVFAGLLFAAPGRAQEVATLALRNGERPSGELVDMNASALIMRVNGQDRSYPVSEVRAVEFVVGPVPAEAQRRMDAGQPFVLLRDGQVIDGRLTDVGGTHPLRITIEGSGGSRILTSNEVGQVWVNPAPRPVAAQAAPAPVAAAIPAGSITVPASTQWTDTGISVSPRVVLVFTATGDINLGPGASSGIGGSPAVTNPGGRYPVPGAPAGALIGRIGNGAAFLIGGNNQPMPMRGSGRLMLGVNDDTLADNSGTFYVAVRAAPVAR